jgi:RNA polymerase-binding transcription factor DksA
MMVTERISSMLTDTNAICSRLTARLAELDAAVARLEKETTQRLDPRFSEQANELEDLATNEALEEVHMAEARAIAVALQRIDAGTYGQCANCGADIAPARLEVLPTAIHCIRCAA